MDDEKKKLILKTKLPEKKAHKLITEKSLEIFEKECSEEEKKIIKSLIQELEKVSFKWVVPKDKNFQKTYKFKIPECYLDLDDGEEILKIDLPEFNEKIERKKLSPNQLSELSKKGEFTVKSIKFSINYIWQISNFIFQGENRRNEILRKQLATAHTFIVRTLRLYSIGKFWHVFDKGFKYQCNVWLGLMNIGGFFVDMADLSFGTPSVFFSKSLNQSFLEYNRFRTNENLLKYDFPETFLICEFLQNLSKQDFFDQIEKKNVNLNKDQEYKKYLKEKAKNTVILTDLIKKTTNYWNDFFKDELDKLEDMEEDAYNLIKNKINQKVFKVILEFFENMNILQNENLKKAFKNKLLSFKILEDNKNLETKELVDKKKEMKELVEKENPYLKNVYFWFHHKIKTENERLEKSIKSKYHQKNIRDLKNNNLHENATLFEKKKNLMDHFSSDISQKRKVKEKIKISAQKSYYKIYHYPPYKKIVSKRNNTTIYHLEKSKKITTESDFYFFRIYNLGLRLYNNSKNISFNMFKYVYDGRYGIKGLLCKEEYFRDFSCDYKTGEVKKNFDKVLPLRKRFGDVLEGIRKSRDEFENTPDNGLFGKNIGRKFNKIECYFFRFVVVGLFFVLGLGSLFSLFMILLCVFLGLSSIVWVFIGEILYAFFRFFLFDEIAVRYGNKYNKKNNIDLVYSRFDLMKNPSMIFPIFTNIIELFILGFGQILHCFFLTVFYPFLALIISIYAFIRFGVRYTYDKVTFSLIIKPLAHVPTRDTNVARKIAGPGISKNLFYSLKFEDCVQLIIAQLEKEKISHFKQILDTIFEKDYLKLAQKSNRMLNKLLNSVFITQMNKIITNKNIYKFILNSQCIIRTQKLNFIKKNINSFKIKFTDEELDRIKKTTQEILKNNLKEYYISTYVWKKYKVKEGHYIRLSSLILKQVFGSYSGFFESIQQTEQRITLRHPKRKSKDIFQSSRKRAMIKRAVKGELYLDDIQPVYKAKQVGKFENISGVNLGLVRQRFIAGYVDVYSDLVLDMYKVYLPNLLK